MEKLSESAHSKRELLLDSLLTGCSESPSPTLELSMSIVLQARAKLRKGTASGGRSEVVTEKLQALPIIFVYFVASLFSQRYQAVNRERVASWRTTILIFLQKFRDPNA